MEGVQCDCGLHAQKKTVSKAGPNHGRQFFTCPAGQCGFFQWHAPTCLCGHPAACRKVQKVGPNTGRDFYCCPTRNGCKFFEWASRSAEASPSPPPAPHKPGPRAMVRRELELTDSSPVKRVRAEPRTEPAAIAGPPEDQKLLQTPAECMEAVRRHIRLAQAAADALGDMLMK